MISVQQGIPRRVIFQTFVFIIFLAVAQTCEINYTNSKHTPNSAYTRHLATCLFGLKPCRWIRLEIIKRSGQAKGFVLLPKRWIVEGTFGWFGTYRRLSKDDEYLTASSEAMIYVAMIHLMVRRIEATR